MKRIALSVFLIGFILTWSATFGQVVSPGDASAIAQKSFANIFDRTGIKGEPSVDHLAFIDRKSVV